MKIKIYSTPTCPYCIAAKKYLADKKIEFENIDVSIDHAKAEEMVKLSGQMGVPVIIVDDKSLPAGRQVIVGFDKAELDKVLNK